ncbi:MAG: fibronectin type III domain-containing protein, partial [Acidobacteria bacterium]|nr:fibronectin type III domain-containing protein [Acidobacteriota bacterium]
GTSVPSNEVQVVVAGPAPPGPPSGLTATATGSTIYLQWIAPTTGGAPTSYLIEAGSASGRTDRSFSTGSAATSFTASGIGPGTYFIRVRAISAAGRSDPSNEVSLVVGPPLP